MVDQWYENNCKCYSDEESDEANVGKPLVDTVRFRKDIRVARRAVSGLHYAYYLRCK